MGEPEKNLTLEPIQTKEEVQAKGRFSWKLFRRILAAVMAAVLIASMALGYAAQIRAGQLQFVGTVLEHAAAVTAENTDYLSESTLKRAWNILRYAVGKPKTYDEYDMYASLAIARAEYDAAIPYIQGCIDHYAGTTDRGRAVLYMRLGSLHALCDDAQAARQCFDRALQLEPSLADAYLLRAQMNSLLGKQELVAEDIRSYDALAGAAPSIRAALGGLYESAGDYENAIKCYSVGLEQAGGSDPELMAARGRCYILTQNMAAAKQDLKAFFANGGQDPTGEYNLMLGLCSMEAGEYPQALNAFHNAINAGYAHPLLVYSQSILCAYITGDYEAVIRDGTKALALDADSYGQDALLQAAGEGVMGTDEIYHWVGLAHMAGQDFAAARASFGSIANTDLAPAGVLYYLGLCNATLGENETAIEYYTQSIEKEQMVSLCLYNRGVAYLQLEKLEEGLTDLVTVLQRNDDADATSAAASLLQELGVNVVFDS